MNDAVMAAEHPQAARTGDFDAVIIGAGISGMFMLYRLRELGMTVPNTPPDSFPGQFPVAVFCASAHARI